MISIGHTLANLFEIIFGLAIYVKDASPPRHKPFGPLQPLPIPQRPWSSISMDHIVELPLSNGYDSILVVVCRLTKMVHFIPCLSTDTAADFAKHFVDNIHRQHGLPSDIVSDRGSLFTSHFWQEVCKMLNIQQNLSPAYHPQSDGQSERTNQTLEGYLRLYCNFTQSDWSEKLPLAEFAYNNTFSASTNKTPFFANFGYHPHFSATIRPSNTPASQGLVEYLHSTHEECKLAMKKAQDSFKKYADEHREESPEFKVGDFVRLKRFHISTTRPSEKLDHIFLGPFKILEAVGTRAYRLKLPASMKIHPVFHVSLLEPYYPNTLASRQVPRPPTPEVNAEGEEEWVFSEILKSRFVGRKKTLQYFVDWTGFGPEDRSWVSSSDFEDDDQVYKERSS